MEREQSLYNDNEIRKRANEGYYDIWFITILTNGDVTKFDKVRKCYLLDAIKAINIFIDSIPTR